MKVGREKRISQKGREDRVKEKGRQIRMVKCHECKGGENFRKKTFAVLSAAAKLEDEN